LLSEKIGRIGFPALSFPLLAPRGRYSEPRLACDLSLALMRLLEEALLFLPGLELVDFTRLSRFDAGLSPFEFCEKATELNVTKNKISNTLRIFIRRDGLVIFLVV
jgi:hypothetical protein